MKTFDKNIGPDEATHDEPPHLDLHYLHSDLWILNIIQLGQNIFKINLGELSKYFKCKFTLLIFGAQRIKMMY